MASKLKNAKALAALHKKLAEETGTGKCRISLCNGTACRPYGSNPVAEALRRSQAEAIHSGTWQAAPSYWAAFQVTGGGR